jgi:hypothetical protein
MPQCRLDLQAIERSLRDVQREFPKINTLLYSRRDSMTDEVLENLLAGYRFVDPALGNAADWFSPQYVTSLLELNHIVLCGLDPRVRKEHHQHIAITAERFYEQVEAHEAPTPEEALCAFPAGAEQSAVSPSGRVIAPVH